MSFSLADIFGTAPALPGAAGGLVPVPVAGMDAAFAEALKSYRAKAVEGMAPDAGMPTLPAAAAQPIPPLVASLLAALPTNEVSGLGLEPDAVQRLTSGVPTETDLEALAAALTQLQEAADTAPVSSGTGPTESAEGDTVGTASGAVVAGTVVPPVVGAAASSAADAPVGDDDNVEMALRLAEAKPAYVPPQTDKPAAAQTISQDGKALDLKEGRSAATAPPVLIDKDSAAKPDVPQVSRAVLAALAPRATATTMPDGTKPAAPAPAAAPAPVATAPQTNISPQAQSLAAMPHVTSVRASMTTQTPPTAAPAAPPQTQVTPQAQASATPPETPVVMAAAAPAAGAGALNSARAPETAPVVELTGGAATEEKAADAALGALVKDKVEAKPETPQARPTAHVANPEIAAAKTPVSGDDVKAKDANSEPQAQVKSAPAEKPSAPEPRAPQLNHTQQLPPAADRVILQDAAARAVQQTAQYLPAAAIPQIAGEMAMRFRQGQSRFEIRLDPPELGRIDVRIEVDSDGHVHSRLMVEKTETLDLLKADQRALERALHDAGFKSEQNSVSFSLRDERGGHAKSEQQQSMNEANVRNDPEDDPARLAAELAYRATMRGPGGIDLRV